MARGDAHMAAVEDAPAAAPDGRPNAANELTVEQLARETGTTVRNIRSHQARGLLPPPEVRARTGYYGDEHVARLRLIQELQGEGFNLKGIKRLLEQEPGPAEALLGLKRAATIPFEIEDPEVLTAEELVTRFGPEVGRKTLAQAERLGVLRPLGGARYEAPSPSLLRAAEAVMHRGVPLPAALSVVEDLQRQCEAVSRSFVKLFLEQVVKPLEDDEGREDRWSEMVESVESLRPLASDVLLAVFRQTMTREVEAAFGKELERRARRGRVTARADTAQTEPARAERVALVTGAARGIGAETARALAARGWRVALVGLEPERLATLAGELGERHCWRQADVTAQTAGGCRGG